MQDKFTINILSFILQSGLKRSGCVVLTRCADQSPALPLAKVFLCRTLNPQTAHISQPIAALVPSLDKWVGLCQGSHLTLKIIIIMKRQAAKSLFRTPWSTVAPAKRWSQNLLLFFFCGLYKLNLFLKQMFPHIIPMNFSAFHQPTHKFSSSVFS